MKILFGLILTTLVTLALSGRGVGDSIVPRKARTESPISSSNIPHILYRPRTLSRSALGRRIDSYIREKFWYYLPECRLTFLGHVEIVMGCHFLITYQNLLGTYLAVATWSDFSSQIHVDTFVRLGDGFAYDSQIAQPIDVHPVVIQLDLGQGQYFISQSEYRDAAFRWQESYISSRKNRLEQSQTNELKHYCSQVEQYIKKQYWYYLTDDTATINIHTSRFRNTCYCSFTFLNYVGLWQVVGAYNNGPTVRTFVRLGEGSDPQKAQKCQIIPSFA